MFYFDYLIFLAPALLLSLWASWRVKKNFNKYSRIGTARGITGAQAAGEVLRDAGITDVQIVRARGFLSDHYNPTNKTLALSDNVYDSKSIAAVGVAAHEAGHAIQHAQHYAPLWIRSLLVPTANIGSSVGYMVMLFGLMLNWANMILVGAVLFAAVLAFQVVTLPVEFDASHRAKKSARQPRNHHGARARRCGQGPECSRHDLRGRRHYDAADAALLPDPSQRLAARGPAARKSYPCRDRSLTAAAGTYSF